MSETVINYIFLATALPFALWITFTDLKYMKITNIAVLSMLAVFIIVGLAFLPFNVFLMRLLGGVIVLVVGFVLFATGGIGGGDVKYAAVMAMFINHSHLARFFFMLSLFCLIAVFLHWLVGKIKFAKPITGSWESWSDGINFPLGFAMSSALVYYLAEVALRG